MCNDDVSSTASPRVEFSIGEVMELDQHSGEEVPVKSTKYRMVCDGQQQGLAG